MKDLLTNRRWGRGNLWFTLFFCQHVCARALSQVVRAWQAIKPKSGALTLTGHLLFLSGHTVVLPDRARSGSAHFEAEHVVDFEEREYEFGSVTWCWKIWVDEGSTALPSQCWPSRGIFYETKCSTICCSGNTVLGLRDMHQITAKGNGG